MHLSPLVWFEIGTAVPIGVAVLWAKPEYGLFLYGVALGFPDIALPLGDAINMRLDDVLAVVFLGRTFLWTPSPLTPGQRKMLAWQAAFLAACILSVAVETAQGSPPPSYEATKMIGCAAVFLLLPRLIQTERRLRFLVAGLICAGIALVIQIIQHLGSGWSAAFVNTQELKTAAAFATWNGNTIGQAATMLVFAVGVGAVIFRGTRLGKIIWPGLALGFALVPALMFVRGTTLSIAAAAILYLFLARHWQWALVFALVCFSVILYLHLRGPQFVQDATQLNLATGEGFSHRFERWDVAFKAVRTAPWLGQGFGQELAYLSLLGSEGRAHNAYLTVWLELGLGGLLLFAVSVFQYVRAGWALHQRPQFRLFGALILALMLALSVDSLGLPTLYWEKLPTIALSLAIVVVGICEREDAVELSETARYAIARRLLAIVAGFHPEEMLP